MQKNNYNNAMKIKTLLLIFPLVLLACSSSHTDLSSPDGKLSVCFRLTTDGVPEYSVCRDCDSVLLWSPLGLQTKEYTLNRGFTLCATKHGKQDLTWETVWGEERYIRDNHHSMIVKLLHESGVKMNIEFRCYDDGVAFRYVFPSYKDSMTITDETTGYRFADNNDVWSIPWRTEYYEGLWQKAPMWSLIDTVCSPITIELKDGGYAFVHEAALYDYPAQNLYVRDHMLCTYLTPWLDESARAMDVRAYKEGSFSTPWRMVIITENLSELVASRIMLNLNEPCAIEDTEWIRPMKFIGIWWGMHIKTMTWEMGPKHGATTENMERYLRFANEHGIEGVLAEGWNKGWEDWRHFSFTESYPDWDMDYLSNLADSLGVAIVGHNETGGNAADYEKVLEEAYAYHADHGIHAVKTGYVAPIIRTLDGLQWNKGQSGVRHYRKVIETAAKYQITIDNHEPVMPTGLQRTYPNLMTQEGVRGQEWNAWSTDGGSPCEHVTVLPYTRILAGPVDYTPGVFHFENPVIPTTRVHSTLMNQLGLFVCFYSPLQMVCDLPEHYMQHPDAFRFVKEVPCDWERSMLLDGKIGDYCVYARQERGGDTWYIGGITDEQARELTLPLTMLQEGAEYQLTLWCDGEDADWLTRPYAYDTKEYSVKKGEELAVKMAPGGGFAAIVKKIE